MPLFIVRHQHDAQQCPAADPDLGAHLLNHLSLPNVRKHGVTIHGEAVVNGEHTLYLIVEADEEALIRRYMAPFAMSGNLHVYAASTCAGVVSRGGCTAPKLPDDELPLPILDPEEACQRAIDDGLVVHRAHPLNGEISIPALIGGVVMPNAKFYIRNHFFIPKIDTGSWRLSVTGLVEQPLNLSFRELTNMRSTTQVVTLECAGNGRSQLQPRTAGEQWNFGAVSTAEWTGVPLIELLDRAGIKPEGKHIIFRGADLGLVDDHTEPIFFERSLSIEQARESEALLAYVMNGEPLPLEHGFPMRLIVPSWYAVASVKWLMDIRVVDQPFLGHYQAERYFFERSIGHLLERTPLTLQRVRSLITEPAQGSDVDNSELTVRGVAWSGAAPVAAVDVQIDDGPWQPARLLDEPKRHTWQRWELHAQLTASGSHTIRSRATDQARNTQPDAPEWNRLGYCNNSIQTTTIALRAQS